MLPSTSCRRPVIALLVAFAFPGIIVAADVPEWETPAINAVNRLPAHARVVPFPDETLAATRDVA